MLLVQAYPSFEYRYLRNMLARDETIELHTVLQEADVEHADAGPGGPARVSRAPRRAVRLRRDHPGRRQPGAAERAVLAEPGRFCDQKAKGGALVLLAGPKYMPLAYRDTPLAAADADRPRPAPAVPDPDEPLTEGFVVEPTNWAWPARAMQLGDTPSRDARRSGSTCRRLYWMLEAPDLKPGVRVLAEHPTRWAATGTACR